MKERGQREGGSGSLWEGRLPPDMVGLHLQKERMKDSV